MKNACRELVLSIQDTNVLKGVALILLLCHHCLYEGNDFNDVIVFGRPFFQTFGIFCKTCVAFFVFLSGYGLTISTINKNGLGGVWRFYRQRYLKLMINYWLIYVLFVPVGIYFFDRSFSFVYGKDWLWPAITDFFGMHYALTGSFYGYNPTWWFYSLIIVLYLAFPVIWKYRSWWFLAIPLCIAIPGLISHLPFLRSGDIGAYMLSFVIGSALAYVKPRVMRVWGAKSLVTLILIVVCYCRLKMPSPILWDAVVALLICIAYKVVGIPMFLSRGLSFVGKHSWNIFLFHTFILSLYFHHIICWSRNPILICATLFFVCLVVSIGLEWLKKLIGIDRFLLLLTDKK